MEPPPSKKRLPLIVSLALGLPASLLPAWLMGGWLGVVIHASALYVVFGIATVRQVDWREKTFSFRWLPPVDHDSRRPSLNAILAGATIAVFVVALWPLYVRLWILGRNGKPPGR